MNKLPGYYEIDEKGLVQAIFVDHARSFSSPNLKKSAGGRSTMNFDVKGFMFQDERNLLANSGPLILS